MKLLRNFVTLLSRNQHKKTLLSINRFYSDEKNVFLGKAVAEQKNDEQIQTDRENYNSAMENNFQSGIKITAYNTLGFRLNQVSVIGPIIVFPRAVFSWHVESVEKINADSLMIFGMVQPKVDVLIIGTGENEATTHIGKNILEIAHKHKINVEVLSTELACTQFNFLTGEGRMVAAALIPPEVTRDEDDDFFNTLILNNRMFSIDLDVDALKKIK